MVILTCLIPGADFELAPVNVEGFLRSGRLAADLATKYGVDIRDRLIEMLFSFTRRYEATSAKLFAFVLAPVSVASLTSPRIQYLLIRWPMKLYPNRNLAYNTSHIL